jgi:hypothetical protein
VVRSRWPPPARHRSCPSWSRREPWPRSVLPLLQLSGQCSGTGTAADRTAESARTRPRSPQYKHRPRAHRRRRRWAQALGACVRRRWAQARGLCVYCGLRESRGPDNDVFPQATCPVHTRPRVTWPSGPALAAQAHPGHRDVVDRAGTIVPSELRKNRNASSGCPMTPLSGGVACCSARGIAAIGCVSRLRRCVLEELHATPLGGHFRVCRDKTSALARRLVCWPSLAQDNGTFIRSSPVYPRVKGEHGPPAGLIYPLPVPTRSGGTISIDIIMELPKARSGHDFMAVHASAQSLCTLTCLQVASG